MCRILTVSKRFRTFGKSKGWSCSAAHSVFISLNVIPSFEAIKVKQAKTSAEPLRR